MVYMNHPEGGLEPIPTEENIKVVLPDSLKNKLPPLPNFIFMSATETGSFSESQELYDVFNAADYNLVLGDLSRNAITGKALAQACRKTERIISEWPA